MQAEMTRNLDKINKEFSAAMVYRVYGMFDLDIITIAIPRLHELFQITKSAQQADLATAPGRDLQCRLVPWPQGPHDHGSLL